MVQRRRRCCSRIWRADGAERINAGIDVDFESLGGAAGPALDGSGPTAVLSRDQLMTLP